MNQLLSGSRIRESAVSSEMVDRRIKDLYYTGIIRAASVERRLN